MRKLAFLTALLLTLLWTLPAAAAGAVILQDDADLLSSDEEARLAAIMAPLSEYGTVMFWTTREGATRNALGKARDFFRTQNGTKSGTVLLIDMAAREIAIFSDGAMYRAITSENADTVTDNVYRYASREQYFLCAQSAFAQMLNLLRGEAIARPMKIVSSALLALSLALLLVYFLIRIRYEYKLKLVDHKQPLEEKLQQFGFAATISGVVPVMTKQTRTRHDSDSGGGRSGGGGGGGGGSSGGGGSHGF